jgi:Ca2+-transporting ATPase
LLSNKPLLISVGFTLILQLCVIYVPLLNEIFRTKPLYLMELIFATGMGLVVFHAVELEKLLKRTLKK